MSFSGEQKRDIISQPIKSRCCKKAMLCGILSSRGGADGDRVAVSLGSRETADQVSSIVRDLYSAEACVTTIPSGGRGYLVSFEAASAARALAEFMEGGSCFADKCRSCQAYFLRGLFVAAGRMTDPSKQYLLEFSVKNRLERFLEIFDELGLEPRISRKPKETVIYFRNSSSIEDFFALAAMNNTTFALMNAKIQGEIRNNVNRIANCETNNINKAVSASASQLEVITELVRTGLVSQLPDELKKTAILRMEHSDLSLSQLASLITPYISKPGLSHRLKKINELGKELLHHSRKHT